MIYNRPLRVRGRTERNARRAFPHKKSAVKRGWQEGWAEEQI